MSATRWAPLLGLFAVLVFAPGALAHQCTGGDTSADQFETQATVTASPVLVAAFVLIPIIGVALAVVGAVMSRGLVTSPATGSWVSTPTQWVWVPNRK